MSKTHEFTLSDSGKEFPARFGKQTVVYEYPQDIGELRENIEAVLAGHTPDEGEAAPTVEDILYSMASGQGGHLNRQKAIKAKLDTEAFKDLSVADAISRAVEETRLDFVNIPGTRRGEGKAGKVAKAEARAAKAEEKVDAAKQQLAEAYLSIPAAARGTFAQSLLDRGLFTQDELDELDNQ